MIYRGGRKVESEDIDQESEDSDEETTLIPRSLLPKGVKVGDEVRLKVVHGFEEELEVSYQHSKKSKVKDDNDGKDDNSTSEPKSEDMDQANSDLDALAT